MILSINSLQHLQLIKISPRNSVKCYKLCLYSKARFIFFLREEEEEEEDVQKTQKHLPAIFCKIDRLVQQYSINLSAKIFFFKKTEQASIVLKVYL